MAFTIQPVVGENFFDRKKELVDILSTLRDKNSVLGFALVGKRRIGKTSLFKEIQRRLQKEKAIVPIYFSIWDLVERNISELAKELSQAILEAYRPRIGLKYKAKEFLELPFNLLRKMISELKLGVEVKDSLFLLFSFEKEKKIEPAELIDEVFALPEKLAQATGSKSVLFLDEFPEIMEIKINDKKVGENIIKKIRTIQEDYKRTSLNISGSIRRTMEVACLSSTSAFYRQFIVKQIQPLNREDMRLLMKTNLRNRHLSEDGIVRLYEITKGIPFYVQFIGRLLNRSETTLITGEEIEKSIAEFLAQEGSLIFKEELERLSEREKLIVTIMASKSVTTYNGIARAVGNKISNLARFLGYLEEKGILEKESKGKYEFTDHIFKMWLSQRTLS